MRTERRAAYALVCKANDATSSHVTSRSLLSRASVSSSVFVNVAPFDLHVAIAAFRTLGEVIMYHIKK